MGTIAWILRPLFRYLSAFVWYRLALAGFWGLLGLLTLIVTFGEGKWEYIFPTVFFLALAAFPGMRGYTMLHNLRHAPQEAIALQAADDAPAEFSPHAPIRYPKGSRIRPRH